MTTQAELYECPVRKRYAWQLLRYGPTNRAWQDRLREAKPDFAQLHALIRSAQTHTLHYARSFASAGVQANDLRDHQDLAHFPLLSRADVQTHFYDLFDARITRHDIEEGWLGVTSGSTGEPLRFFMDAESIHFFVGFVRHLWRLLDCGPLPLPWQTGIVLLCTLPRSSIYSARMPLFRGTLFRKLHWAEPDAGRVLGELAPRVITGDPASLSVLADAIESGLTQVAPKLILSSAFAMSAELEQRLRALTGAQVIDYYSLAETGPIAWRCQAGSHHVIEAAAHVELVDDEIVLSNLRNRLFPLIRYRTGDLGELTRERCACGREGLRLSRMVGRISARFLRSDGVRVDPSQVQPLLAKLEVRQFRVNQLDSQALQLVLSGEREPAAELITQIEAAFSRLLRAPIVMRLQRQAAPLFASGEKPIVFHSSLNDKGLTR